MYCGLTIIDYFHSSLSARKLLAPFLLFGILIKTFNKEVYDV